MSGRLRFAELSKRLPLGADKPTVGNKVIWVMATFSKSVKTEVFRYDLSLRFLARIGCWLFLALVLASCSSGGSSSGGSGSSGGSSTDFRFLFNHNADQLNGHTIRWESNNIKVYTAGLPGAEAAINRWAGPVSFTFVSSPPSDGITFKLDSSTTLCGQTNTFYFNSGKIAQAVVSIFDQTFCRGGLPNTVAHETAHALGFFGHTADGGLMDPDGGNGNITTQDRNFMNLLYSQPFGWDITPFLSLNAKLTNGRYQPNGTQIIMRVES